MKTSTDTINKMCNESQIILLQEHWLYPDELQLISQLNPNFSGFGISSMCLDDKFITGRPHGGIGILWEKSLSQSTNIIKYEDTRILGLEIECNNAILLFLCVYLPYECDMFYDDYIFYLNKIKIIIESANTPYVYVLGDFNADIQSDSVFGSELVEFCNLNKLDFIDRIILPSSSFTFISQAHGTTSWLDHCITTAAGRSLISNAFITDNVICSDHFPLSINIECSIDLTYDYNFQMKHVNLPQWRTANDLDKNAYTICTNEKLSNIKIPINALLCKESNCTIHCKDIDIFYNNIVAALKTSGTECIPMSHTDKNSSFRTVAGWNEYVKEHYSIAQDALWLWKYHNKPNNGAIYHNMRSSKSIFKYALRSVRKSEEMIRADAMASDLLNNDQDSFWKEVKKLNSCKSILTNMIDGISGESNITNLWKNHFCNILNANVCDSDLKNNIMVQLENIQYTNDMTVSARDVSNLISQLKCGKAAGSDDLCAEYFRFAHDKLHALLSMCFTLFFTHCYLPLSMIETIIVPIVKNKCGNLSDSNNYRPIALATIISKLFESAILLKCEMFLDTCPNQFGFKKGHSTDMCIYVLKEFIEFYRSRNTSVFVTFLDASKAYDKIDHWQLFNKLLNIHVPVFIISILLFWYSRQEMFIRF